MSCSFNFFSNFFLFDFLESYSSPFSLSPLRLCMFDFKRHQPSPQSGSTNPVLTMFSLAPFEPSTHFAFDQLGGTLQILGRLVNIIYSLSLSLERSPSSHIKRHNVPTCAEQNEAKLCAFSTKHESKSGLVGVCSPLALFCHKASERGEL